MITISVSRTGGIAGLSRTWTVTVSDDDAAEPGWRSLVDACPWDEWDPSAQVASSAEPSQPDRYVYRIIANSHRAEVAEQAVTGPWRTLVDHVKEAAD